MALLSRRCVQELLDELDSKPALVASMVRRLNLYGRAALDAEWELIVLSALSRVGVVAHEPNFGGSSNLDLHFTGPTGLKFSGEITAISDSEISRQNPVDLLISEINRRTETRGIRGHIGISIGSTRTSTAVSLRLPAPHEFTRYIFNGDFAKFLDDASRAPNSRHEFHVNNDKACVSIWYSPGRWHLSIRYAPFKGVRDIVRNALYNRLKKKVDQIKRSGSGPAEGLRGIIVCDADCELLLQPIGTGTLTFERIARHFLTKAGDLDFIAALSVRIDHTWDGQAKPYVFDVHVVDRDRDREPMMTAVFYEGLRQIPSPVRLARNARFRLEQQSPSTLEYQDHTGTSLLNQRITLSARAVFDYIAGRIDRERFNVLVDDWMVGILKHALDGGGLVTSIRMSSNAQTDDDELHIDWREQDPAASPFQMRGRGDHR
jgi:hypothetical protein